MDYIVHGLKGNFGQNLKANEKGHNLQNCSSCAHQIMSIILSLLEAAKKYLKHLSDLKPISVHIIILIYIPRQASYYVYILLPLVGHHLSIITLIISDCIASKVKN